MSSNVEIKTLRDRLIDLQSKKSSLDEMIKNAVQALELERSNVVGDIDRVSENLAKLELEAAASGIVEAEKNAIEAVSRFNKMSLLVTNEDGTVTNGTLALLRSNYPQDEKRTYLGSYSVHVVEYEPGWFTSEVN